MTPFLLAALALAALISYAYGRLLMRPAVRDVWNPGRVWFVFLAVPGAALVALAIAAAYVGAVAWDAIPLLVLSQAAIVLPLSIGSARARRQYHAESHASTLTEHTPHLGGAHDHRR